jgi:hypothetical protein
MRISNLALAIDISQPAETNAKLPITGKKKIFYQGRIFTFQSTYSAQNMWHIVAGTAYVDNDSEKRTKHMKLVQELTNTITEE